MLTEGQGMLKKLKNRLRPQWVRQLGKRMRVRAKVTWLSRKHGLAAPVNNPLALCKTSDTLFILGNGGSILEYSPEDWKHIGKRDSLGFNYWMLHDFVPSCYMTELPKFPVDEECLLHNLRVRQDEYRKIPIFLKDFERFPTRESDRFLGIFPPALKSNAHALWDVELEGESPARFEEQLVKLLAAGAFEPGAASPLPRKRATIFLACVMGVRAGYRNIVLCGVDLSNTAYFYHPIADQLEAKGLRPLPSFQPGVIHKTNDPAYGALTISTILDIFDRVVLKPKGIKLSVALKSSALHPRFPSYFQ